MGRKRGRDPSGIKGDKLAVENAEGPIEEADVRIEHGRPSIYAADPRFWPAWEPLPTEWRKARRQRPACPRCRRLQLDDGGQAVVVMSSGGDVAFFRCKACEHRWQLPVKMV